MASNGFYAIRFTLGRRVHGRFPWPWLSFWSLGIHYITKNMKVLFTLIVSFGLAFASFADSPDKTASSQLLSRSYKVNTETFLVHLKQRMPPNPKETDTELLLRYFKREHVEIKPPESIFWNEKLSRIFARATKPDQDKIQQLIIEIADH